MVSLCGLKRGATLEVPFRLFSEQSIRTAAWRAKRESGGEYSVNVAGATKAVVKRI